MNSTKDGQLPDSLTPEQIESLRKQAIKAGIKLDQPTFQRLTGGGIKLMVEIPAELAVPLLTWAEAAGENEHDFIEKQIVTAVSSYVFAGVVPE